MSSFLIAEPATVPFRPRSRLVALVLGLSLTVVAFGANTGTPLVALDVGHSLRHPGALSARGRTEFTFNRTLATAIARALRKRAFRIRLIGADGALDDLYARPRQAAGAALLLSIHHDSVQPRYLEEWVVDRQTHRYSDRYSGFSLFVSRHNPQWTRSLACASRLGAQLRAAGFRPSSHHAEPIPGENRSFADRENGVYVFDDLVVLRTATQAAILLEAGVIVNRAEERELRKPATQRRIATALAAGVAACFEIPPLP